MTVRAANEGDAQAAEGPTARRPMSTSSVGLAAPGAPASLVVSSDAFFPPTSDPLGAWIEERRRAFNDFERSFWDGGVTPTAATVASAMPEASPPFALATRDPFGPPPSLFPPFRSRPLFALEDRGGSLEAPLETSAATMLSSRDSGQDLSPKARVTYDDGRFQVEFDVRDYRPEELSIKTEGDVLIVLAKHETKTEDGGSFVSKQFEQRFTLPSGVKPESITSSLARDGTLTVSAPRETPAIAHHSPVGKKNSNNELTNVYGHEERNEGLPHPRVKYDDDKFQISLDCHRYRPEELDVKVEGSSIIITAKQEQKESGGTRTRVFEQKFTLPSGVRAEKVTSSYKDGNLIITAPRANSISSSSPPPPLTHHRGAGERSASDVEARMDRVLSPATWEDNFTRRESGTIGTGVTTLGGGPPHMKHTSLFDRDQALFPSSSLGDGANGISKVQIEDDTYKIMVNAQDFRPEELIIKTVGNTVHFEAKHEEKTSDGHSYSSKNISQSFTLPRGVDPETVTSSLSKGGVLTISAPLPPALRLQQAGNERLVPIKHR